MLEKGISIGSACVIDSSNAELELLSPLHFAKTVHIKGQITIRATNPLNESCLRVGGNLRLDSARFENCHNQGLEAQGGTEDSVIGIIKFKAVKRLLKIFAHETVQKFDGFTDREATHYFQPEQEKVEANFMRETVPLFFGLEDDEPEENLSHDEMAHLSVVFAGFQRTTALVRRMQHKILTSYWEP
ncbi:unnamed protein product [Effrenium voratum]|nr:unnamed protein product [Effrenium voratum]